MNNSGLFSGKVAVGWNYNLLADNIPEPQVLQHAEAVLHMIETFTNDRRYREIEDDIRNMVTKGEMISMCTFAERMENKGIQEGLQKGLQEGLQEGLQKGLQVGARKKLVSQVQVKLAKGKSVEEIADALEETIESINQLIKELQKENK